MKENLIKLGHSQCCVYSSEVTEIPGQCITTKDPHSNCIVYEDTTKYNCKNCGIVKSVYKKSNIRTYLDVGFVYAPYIPTQNLRPIKDKEKYVPKNNRHDARFI